MPVSYKKSPAEIILMRECGRRLRDVTAQLIPCIWSGMTTRSIDEKIGILLRGAEIAGSFQTVPGYPWNSCLAVNEQAVHTMPSSYVLRPGDVLTIDVGGLYKGYHSDWATTIIVDDIAADKKTAFLAAGRTALERTLAQMRSGVSLNHIGGLMERSITSAGYRVLTDLTGHGIGRELHEDPHIPNVASRSRRDNSYVMEEGFVAAIEIIYSESCEKIIQTNVDGWSLDTADGSLAACFEHTVLVTKNGVEILT